MDIIMRMQFVHHAQGNVSYVPHLPRVSNVRYPIIFKIQAVWLSVQLDYFLILKQISVS